MDDHCFQSIGNVHVAPDADVLYDDLAHVLMAAADDAVDQRGVFHLALSGGTTPEPFYLRLILDPRYRQIPWQQTHLWLVDERRVPENDQQSNIKIVREALADHIPMPKRFLHPIRAWTEDPAGEYERLLRHHVQETHLDFVLLGMGGDGHTASLFPGSPALDVADKLVTVNEGPAVTPPDRVTMTYPLLNAANQVAVLVTGSEKAATLCQVECQLQESGPDPRRFPITGIHSTCGSDRFTWYLDAAAAGMAR